MIFKVLAYKDTKLNVFAQPIYEKNLSNEDIIEGFRRMCANPELPKAFFGYDVYLLGTFDDKIAKFESIDPEFLCSLADFAYLAEGDKENVVS